MTIIARLYRFRWPHAVEMGILLGQGGEFAFVVVGLALSFGLLPAETAQFMLIVVGSTMFLTPLLARLATFTGAALLDRGRTPIEEMSEVDPELSDHVIIVGANTLGVELARKLHERGEAVIVIDIDATKLRSLPCPTLTGDASMRVVLDEAGFDRARVLVTTLHVESVNDFLAYRCHVAGVTCSAHAVDVNHVSNLLDMEVDYLMVPKVDGIKLQTRKLKELGYLDS